MKKIFTIIIVTLLLTTQSTPMGFASSGSRFSTVYETDLSAIEAEGARFSITGILQDNADTTGTRFGSASVLAEICGDAVKGPGEQCDEGASNSDTTPDACRNDCTTATCGDSVVDTGEQCDGTVPAGITCLTVGGFTDRTITFPNESGTVLLSGGTIDASTLDTLDSTQFLRSDTSDSFTSGTFTLSDGTTLDVDGNTTIGNATTDTLTITSTIGGASPFIFEGTTADGFEQTFAITDPTADTTVTFPDASGEVSLLGQTISGSEIVDGSVDISDDTNLVGGTNITLSGDTLNVDDAFILNTGDTATGAYDFTGATIEGGSPFVFEGATDNAFESTIAVTDPTADRTITFKDESGTVAYLSDVTGGEWTDTGTIIHPGESTVDEVAIGGTSEAGADIFLGVDGTAVFNEQSGSVDFRVESNANANMIFVDGSEDEIGIGTGTPDDFFHLYDPFDDAFIVLEKNDNFNSGVAFHNDSKYHTHLK